MTSDTIAPYSGVMIGADGRPKVIIDYGVLVDLVGKASAIERPGQDDKPFTLEEIEELVAELELFSENVDAIDIAAAKAVENDETFPFEMTQRMIDGESPIKVFRQHRGMKQKDLAKKAGTTNVYISQIENRTANASLKLLRKIAAALNVTIDDLVE